MSENAGASDRRISLVVFSLFAWFESGGKYSNDVHISRVGCWTESELSGWMSNARGTMPWLSPLKLMEKMFVYDAGSDSFLSHLKKSVAGSVQEVGGDASSSISNPLGHAGFPMRSSDGESDLIVLTASTWTRPQKNVDGGVKETAEESVLDFFASVLGPPALLYTVPWSNKEGVFVHIDEAVSKLDSSRLSKREESPSKGFGRKGV